jgi:plasmid stabilization system protein ParE
MAEGSGNLTISISARASSDLAKIWDWNAERYNAEHADLYIAFLREATNHLLTGAITGKPVPSRRHLSYIMIKRRRHGHGHIAVFERIGNVVSILSFFHTAQDWQARLAVDE